MKHTRPDVFLTRALLCFVRDAQPAVDEFISHFGAQAFHLLRKPGIIVIEEDRLRLSERFLSPDGQRFVWGCKVIHLDEDIVDLVRWERDAADQSWYDGRGG